MTISDLGAIGDFVASIGVIASLVFLGVQIRQSSRIARATAVRGAADYLLALGVEVAKSPDLRRLMSRVDRLSWAELSPEERVMFGRVARAVFSTFDHIAVQMRAGIVSREYWDLIVGSLRSEHLVLPVYREWWTLQEPSAFSAVFRDEVARVIAAVERETPSRHDGDGPN